MAKSDKSGLRDHAFAPPLDAYAFFAFVVAGCGYIAVAKLRDAPQWQVTLVPVVLMLAYAAMMLFARGFRLRSDYAGDNLYYMGFLFTLTSLGMALYRFSADSGSEDLVRNFGIAIASTIAGVALRVAFNQMRRDPIEVEHTSRLELADAARRVRRELDATVTEMNFFRRTVHQSFAEGFEDMRKVVAATTEEVVKGLKDMNERARVPVDEASQASLANLHTLTAQMITALGTTAQSLSEENGRLAKGAGDLTTALEAITARLAAISTVEHVIELKVGPVVQEIQTAAQRINVEADDRLKQFGVLADQLQAGLSQSVKTFETRTAANEEAQAILVRVTAALSHAAVTLAKAAAASRQPVRQSEPGPTEAEQTL
jgi:hypothetical protein